MPSNDKLYEIFEKYNLNSQSVKSVETKKHANINEVYQNYKISKYNFIHKNSYKANISEVVFGNVFKIMNVSFTIHICQLQSRS